MSLDTQGIIDAVASHAAASGFFERVNAHEPKNAPGNGVTGAVWVDRGGPAPGQSGLSSTSALLVLKFRVYTNMLAEPSDAIDPAVMNALDALVTAWSGDFELGGQVRNVDLLGASGVPLSWQAGYLSQDNRVYRVMDLTLPLVISDVWAQAA
jgi:hypothetical protein